MSADWFCKIAGREFGPLSAEELKAMVAEGSLTPHHQLRRGSDGPWVAAASVKGLFAGGKQSAWEEAIDAVEDHPPPQQQQQPAQKPLPRAKPMPHAQPAPTKEVRPPPAAPPPAAPPPAAAVPAAHAPTGVPQAMPAAPHAPHAPTGMPQAMPAAPAQSPPQQQPAMYPHQYPQGMVAPQAAPHAMPQAMMYPQAYGYGAPQPTHIGHHATSEEAALLARRRKQNKMLFNGGLIAILVLAIGGVVAWAIASGGFGSAPANLAGKKPAKSQELDPLAGYNSSKTSDDQPAAGPTDAAGPAGTEPRDYKGEVKWVDASSEPIRRGDVEVRLVQVGPGKVFVYDEQGNDRGTFRSEMLIVKLAVKNVGGKPTADYAPWSYRYAGIVLKDNMGLVIRPAKLREMNLFASGQQREAKVAVDGAVDDLLVFTLPRETFRSLRLQLAGSAVGSAEPLGFEIPAAMMRDFETPDRPGSKEFDGDEMGLGRSGISEIDRGIKEVGTGGISKPDEPARPDKKGIPGVMEEDPDGDVSKINRDIEAMERERMSKSEPQPPMKEP